MTDDAERSPEPAHEARSDEAQHKVEQPHDHFAGPAEVVVDPALSKDDKVRVLEAMEQDARQMAVASDEGMDGGEGTALAEVLAAKDTLELPPFDLAVSAVIQTLRSRLPEVSGTDTHALICSAIEALEVACAAVKARTDEVVNPSAAS